MLQICSSVSFPPSIFFSQPFIQSLSLQLLNVELLTLPFDSFENFHVPNDSSIYSLKLYLLLII